MITQLFGLHRWDHRLLGVQEFVSGIFTGSAANLQILLPAIVFAVAIGMSFATGTSLGYLWHPVANCGGIDLSLNY